MQRTTLVDHLILLIGVLLMVGPIAVALMTSSHTAADIHVNGLSLLPGGHFVETYEKVLTQRGGFTGDITGLRMILNSLILASALRRARSCCPCWPPMRSSISGCPSPR